ncbi:MAG: D-2-hydroxyacid dehydrogenase [Candidatus Sulfotelmatobacter sp.]
MRKNTILVLANPTDPQLSILETLKPEANIVVGNSAEVFATVADGASVILSWSGPASLLRELFRKCPNVRWIHTRAAGVERIVFPELIESSVIVTNGTGTFSSSLGEFVLAAILYFAKDLRRMVRNQAARMWEPFDVMAISGHTLGIIGYGDIGHAVASRVRPMGMRVLAIKRHVSQAYNEDNLVEQIYSPDRRLEMLPRCDYVVATAPLTIETRGMIGQPEFAALKPTAVVINVGRGPVIDEEALVRALSEGRIKGAALDVFNREPLPKDHPFYRLENVLLSPHCADHTHDWLDKAMELFLAQFERFRNSQPLMNVVDKKLGY